MKKKREQKALRGAAAAESRYSRLRDEMDNLLFNQEWVEVDVRHPQPSNRDYTFIDLFSGAGGLSCGLRKAGFRKLLSLEIDDDASATIHRNFPESVHIEGPIESLDVRKELPHLHKEDLTLLAGGVPCQGFSVAGYRRVDDPRNSMVHHFLRWVRDLRPQFVLIENVPGILTLDKGRFKDLIFSELSALGYSVAVRILEAADFGVPQMRARAVFVANRLDLKNPYPKRQLTKPEYVPVEKAIVDLANRPPEPSINHEWTRHSQKMEKRIAAVEPGASLYATFRDAWKRQHMGVPTMTIKENHGGTHIHPWLNRVISAREMARLQTFPDDYIFEGTMKRAMWQIGNAVPVRLAEVIGLAIRSTLDSTGK